MDSLSKPKSVWVAYLSWVEITSVATIKDIDLAPEEVEVKIALKAVSGTGNLWNFALVKAEGEGTIEMTFKWKSQKKESVD